MGEELSWQKQFGIQNHIGAPVITTRYAEQAISCLPPRATKFTFEEWKLSNKQRERNTVDQQHLAESVLAESQRIIDETKDRSETYKSNSDKRTADRIEDIEFNKNELQIVRKDICVELEALNVYKTRLQGCIAALESALSICRKCLILRDGRLGIDLVVDEIDKALQQEIAAIVGGQGLLKRVLEQLNEQMRRLRSRRYLLDRDLEYKQGAINIDKSCLSLKPTDTCLSIYEGYGKLDTATINVEEYNEYSANNIKLAAQEVTAARPIRMYVDTLLKQIIDDLSNLYKNCNHAFNERIKETKTAKEQLEDMHRKTAEKILEMKNNIINLQKALVEKEGFLGLAHTRLGRRAERYTSEQVRDRGGQALLYECEMLRYSTEQLQQMLNEANSSLRYLSQVQIQLAEDINIKMNTLKIDDVDCMTLRQTVDYHAY